MISSLNLDYKCKNKTQIFDIYLCLYAKEKRLVRLIFKGFRRINFLSVPILLFADGFFDRFFHLIDDFTAAADKYVSQLSFAVNQKALRNTLKPADF